MVPQPTYSSEASAPNKFRICLQTLHGLTVKLVSSILPKLTLPRQLRPRGNRLITIRQNLPLPPRPQMMPRLQTTHRAAAERDARLAVPLDGGDGVQDQGFDDAVGGAGGKSSANVTW